MPGRSPTSPHAPTTGSDSNTCSSGVGGTCRTASVSTSTLEGKSSGVGRTLRRASNTRARGNAAGGAILSLQSTEKQAKHNPNPTEHTLLAQPSQRQMRLKVSRHLKPKKVPGHPRLEEIDETKTLNSHNAKTCISAVGVAYVYRYIYIYIYVL